MCVSREVRRCVGVHGVREGEGGREEDRQTDMVRSNCGRLRTTPAGT